MPYIEPKIIKQLELECDYRMQGYPINGLAEIARNDVYGMIKDELGPFEEKELVNQFDMDINPIIDSQSIQ
jgi:hypothetical protein